MLLLALIFNIWLKHPIPGENDAWLKLIQEQGLMPE